MRYHEILVEAAVLPPAGQTHLPHVLDLRNPHKIPDPGNPYTPTYIALTDTGGAIIYVWGDYNIKPWVEILQITGGSKDSRSVTVQGDGYTIDVRKEIGSWSGERNPYSDDVREIVQTLLRLQLAKESTPIWLHGRINQSLKLGTVRQILARPARPSKLILYHGTSNARLEMIMQTGLKPLSLDQRVWNIEKTRPEHRDSAIYLTASLFQAEYYAQKAVNIDRKRIGSSARISAKRAYDRAEDLIKQLKAQQVRYQSMTPEQIAAEDEHYLKYHSWDRHNTIDFKMQFIPDQITQLEQVMAKNRFVAHSVYVNKMEPVILQIILTKRDFRYLLADDDFLRANPNGDPRDWWTSLSDFGQVAYLKTIMPDQIKVIPGRPSKS